MTLPFSTLPSLFISAAACREWRASASPALSPPTNSFTDKFYGLFTWQTGRDSDPDPESKHLNPDQVVTKIIKEIN